MSRKIWTFHGGIHPAENKQLSLGRPLQTMPVPDRVRLPLQQHIGQRPEPLVRPGDVVRTGQLIAAARHPLCAPLHASISGRVTAVDDFDTGHVSGLPEPCIEIHSDGRDEWVPLNPVRSFRSLSGTELVTHLRNMGLSGLGGAGFPTATKLDQPARQGLDTLIINGAECEPYITADDCLMQTNAENIMRGVCILMHMLKPERCLIGIEDNKPAAIRAMRAAASCPDAQGLVEVVVIPTKYPSGSEKQLIRLLTGLEVPSGGIPLDLDISCVNTGTAAAIADAVLEGRPLIDRVVTLTGRSLARPGNYRIRLGTLATDALRFAGLEEATIARLIMGGPMMGHSILHTDAPVIKTTNCLIAGTADEFPPPPPAMPCIRCGHCEQVCPAGLLPQQLYLYARGKDHEKLRDHHLMDCIECGACAYVCESHIPLVQYYRASKADIRSAEAEKRKSDRARFRFETRKTRLEQEAAEREAKRKANAERATRLREQKHQQAKAAPPSDNQESGV